ncbi:MAG: DUF58 domain-containing protein [Chloroflexi bacterium]|nr:DUF58 domain-containing protein [Chloroflexota bacterium]
MRPPLRSRRVVLYSGVALALLAGGATLGSVSLALVSLAPFCLAAMAWVLRLPASVQVERSPLRQVYRVGDEITVEWDITVTEGVGIIVLTETAHPAALALVQGKTLRVFWKGLKPLSKRVSYTLGCTKRGVYTFPETRWSALDVFGFQDQVSGGLGNAFEYRVLPRTMAVRRVKHLRSQSATPIPVLDRARLGVTTTDFRELREYHYGDQLSAINWKATARQGWRPNASPLVNEYEVEGKKAVWLFLDAKLSMQVGTSIENPMERGIDAVSSVGRFFLQRGYRVGAYFYGAKKAGLLLPEVGMQQYVRLSRALSEVESASKGQDLMEAVMQCRQHLLIHHPLSIIVTRLDTDQSRRLAEGIRRLSVMSSSGRFRMPILVISVHGYFFAEPQDSVEESAVTLVSYRTRAVVRSLRRYGARILEWDPSKESIGQLFLRQVKVP